jgi:hypothetical protein
MRSQTHPVRTLGTLEKMEWRVEETLEDLLEETQTTARRRRRLAARTRTRTRTWAGRRRKGRRLLQKQMRLRLLPTVQWRLFRGT